MMHLWMNSSDGFIEVESVSLTNNYREYDQAMVEAQEWADRFREPVWVYDYEGHEDLEDGELMAIVEPTPPNPVQLTLIGEHKP